MIREVNIKNYKTVVNQALSLGMFNIVIGANGCGKSNVLEAIALAGLSASNKLDEELFKTRGIRLTDPRWMTSAFSSDRESVIEIKVTTESEQTSLFRIQYDSEAKPSKWVDLVEQETIHYLQGLGDTPKTADQLLEFFRQVKAKDTNVLFRVEGQTLHISHTLVNGLKSFVIYSPEESALRSFEPSGSGLLGRNGQGLFPYLKKLSQQENGDKILNEIKRNLEVIDWFDDLDFPKDNLSQDYSVRLHDRFLEETLNYFDQRSANEAFLYLLFYFTLLISDETPSFFAIDNVESSLNPKLCQLLMAKLIHLAKEHNKQLIVTTHSPYILDALDLSDNEQRLWVARRDLDGYTVMNNIPFSENVSVPLSEAWMKGYLGGLPNNF